MNIRTMDVWMCVDGTSNGNCGEVMLRDDDGQVPLGCPFCESGSLVPCDADTGLVLIV
jgi:hypothetical protein